MWAGRAKGTSGIFIDERADERQADVLQLIFSGRVVVFLPSGAALFSRRPADSWSGGAHGLRSRLRRPHPLGMEIAGKSESVGEGDHGPDEPAGKIPAAHERARLRGRTRPSTCHLGQVDNLLRQCIRFQVPMDDKFE